MQLNFSRLWWRIGGVALWVIFPLFYVRTSQALDVGDKAPIFVLKDLSQNEFSLSSVKGKYIYLDFWASWCGPCKRSLPWLRKVKERFGPQGLEIIAVNLDIDEHQVFKFLKGNQINFPILRDPEGTTPSLYNVSTMPTSFLIDPDGKLIYVHPGFGESDQTGIEQILERTLHPKDSRI